MVWGRECHHIMRNYIKGRVAMLGRWESLTGLSCGLTQRASLRMSLFRFPTKDYDSVFAGHSCTKISLQERMGKVGFSGAPEVWVTTLSPPQPELYSYPHKVTKSPPRQITTEVSHNPFSVFVPGCDAGYLQPCRPVPRRSQLTLW